jgi:hypothetical protein
MIFYLWFWGAGRKGVSRATIYRVLTGEVEN